MSNYSRKSGAQKGKEEKEKNELLKISKIGSFFGRPSGVSGPSQRDENDVS